ncbi:hypothetical protein LIA77_04542 [Sarocladium implicatum]|nr:hypothetical protein LIA77_04542 [Sarocladium implicatum]
MGVFNRHKESDGRIWYTIKSKLQRIRKNRDHKFFEMPSIVIDLDAEGRRGVRTYQDDEDEQMGKRWFENPRRTAAYSSVGKLQRQVGDSRQQWAKILADPADPWRLNQHDVMSVALRGVERLGPDQTPDHDELLFLRTLCKRNGIPKHATENDTSMLEWMLIRKSAMEEHVADQPSHRLTTSQFVKAINNAGSLSALRRITATGFTGSLGDESDGTNLFTDGAAARSICATVAKFTEKRQAGSSDLLEAMTILGNTSSYLLERQPQDSAMLWRLGLQIASSHSLLTQAETIRRGLRTGLVRVEPSGLEVILIGLQTILTKTDEPKAPVAWRLAESRNRQVLFETLIGIEGSPQPPAITPTVGNTLRSLLVSLGPLDSNTSPGVRRDLCSVYFVLLGRLGAVRTLWAESRLLHDLLPAAELEAAKEDMLTEIVEAAAQSPIYEGGWVSSSVRGRDLTKCAKMDYQDMVNQGRLGSFGTVKSTCDRARLRAALDGRLDKWLEELARDS